MPTFSTHVLDIATGEPARGMRIDLHALLNGERRHIVTITTNDDGRSGELRASIDPGTYELTFHAADYFRAQGRELDATPFLDQIVVRFGVSDVDRNYHVPLLLGPYGYSTYRGS
jgi:5-hydroxyisourate hydrolase